MHSGRGCYPRNGVIPHYFPLPTMRFPLMSDCPRFSNFCDGCTPLQVLLVSLLTLHSGVGCIDLRHGTSAHPLKLLFDGTAGMAGARAGWSGELPDGQGSHSSL